MVMRCRIIKSNHLFSGNTAHRKTKKRQKQTKTQKHTQNHKQTSEGQTDKIKRTTSTNYKLTTSTTLTHHSVNTVLS